VLGVFDQESRVVAAAQFSGEGRQFALPAFCFSPLLGADDCLAVLRNAGMACSSCVCESVRV